MPDTDRIAIAAHLHVLLRRKTGRVTDTEWMAANADYADEVVRFARQRAQEDGVPELAEWADRLALAMHQDRAIERQPLINAAMQAVQAARERAVPEAPRYVGGIR